MQVKTIKGIREDKWAQFKSLAAKKRIVMGRLFETMVDDYSKHSDKTWNKILSGEKIISDEEANKLHDEVKSLRKDYGFRK